MSHRQVGPRRPHTWGRRQHIPPRVEEATSGAHPAEGGELTAAPGKGPGQPGRPGGQASTVTLSASMLTRPGVGATGTVRKPASLNKQLVLASEQRAAAWNAPASAGRGSQLGGTSRSGIRLGGQSRQQALAALAHIPGKAGAGTHCPTFHPDGVDGVDT